MNKENLFIQKDGHISFKIETKFYVFKKNETVYNLNSTNIDYKNMSKKIGKTIAINTLEFTVFDCS